MSHGGQQRPPGPRIDPPITTKPSDGTGEPEYTDATIPARSPEQIATEAIATLDRYLGFFTEKGHPGRPCLRTGWVHEESVRADQARAERLRKELADG